MKSTLSASEWRECGASLSAWVGYGDNFPAVRRRVMDLVQAAIDSGENFDLRFVKSHPSFRLCRETDSAMILRGVGCEAD